MQSEELFAPKLLIRHIEQSSPPPSSAAGQAVHQFGLLKFDRVTVQVAPDPLPPPVRCSKDVLDMLKHTRRLIQRRRIKH